MTKGSSQVAGQEHKAEFRIPASEVLAAQTRQLYAALPSVLVLTAVAAGMLYVIHWPVQDRMLLTAWLAVFFLQVIVRLCLYRAFRAEFPLAEAAGKWYSRFWWTTVLSAVIWGAGAWVFFIEDAPFQQALLAFFVAGLGAGGIVNLAARWQCAWWFLPLALLPYAWRFWEVDQPLSDAIAVFILLFIAVLMTLSRQISRRALDNILRALEQQQLVEQTGRERAHYQSLVESTSAIIWEGRPGSFAFTYISPEAEKILGYPVADWLDDDEFWLAHVHPGDRDWVARYCRKATERGDDHVFDYRMRASDGRVVWLRDVVKLIWENGRPVKVVGVMIDISELKDAQHEIEYVSGLQNLMVESSRRFLQTGEKDFDREMSTTLERIGQWCRTDRAYLIRFSDDLSSYTNTHEWVADGISAEKDNMVDVPGSTLPEMLPRLERNESVVIHDVEKLGPEWESEQEIFQQQSIRSIIVLPIFHGIRLAALIGFDSCSRQRDWTDAEVATLRILADLIGAALEHGATEQQLRASEALRMHAEALAGMGSWEWEEGSEDFHASPEWRNVFGCTRQELTRQSVLAMTPEEDRPRVEAALKLALETGQPYDIEHRIVRADTGEQRWVKVHAELEMTVSGKRRLRGFAQDISQRKQTEGRLVELAHYDSLTGLPNRVLLVDRLEHALKRAERYGSRVALLFLDLDQFKKVNDTLGHDAGDRVLADAAERLAGLFRRQDTVARIGGDEFVIVLEDLENDADITVAAGKVLEAFRTPLRISGQEFMLTASIGIAVAPDDGTSSRELMRNADTAMYHAKSRGRDAYQFFARSMNQRIARQLSLEQALRGAVQRGELTVAYQPLVRLADGAWFGAEALLRWRHPELGQVAADEFIAVAEQSGMIAPLGEFAIETAMQQVSEWRRQSGRDLRLSVNVSPRQFRDPELAHRLLGWCRQHHLPPHLLEVEVTESVLLSGRQQVLTTLELLREAGAGIVMDDFGSGYASLSYLRDYPFTGLKIDRSFIADLAENPRNRKLVVSAIQLGRALGMHVLAEGVENEQQRHILIEEGCELGQGYLFSRPADAATFGRTFSGQNLPAGS